MPYVEEKIKRCYVDIIDSIPSIGCSGTLNYIITKICHKYIEQHVLNYGNLNEVIGVLEMVKLELYRQIASPYEDDKKSMNGPVSSLDGRV